MRRRCVAAVLLTALFCSFVMAWGSAGSASDPAITLSYLEKIFFPMLSKQVSDRAETVWKPLFDDAVRKLETQSAGVRPTDRAAVVNALAEEYLEKTAGVRYGFAAHLTPIACRKGDVLTGSVGTGFVLHTGDAQVNGPSGAAVVNISTGREMAPGAAVPAGQRLLVADRAGTGLRIVSDTATVTVDGHYSLTPAYQPQYTDLADALYAVKLFLGTPTGYHLERAPSRLEALVMMIRLLGEESAALAYQEGAGPFRDVPDWGRPYVGYAYSRGYTAGTSLEKGLFSPDRSVTPEQYMTFLLRALGYSDRPAGDFAWERALDFAVETSILSAAEAAMVRVPFYRDQVVYLSYYALSARMKGASVTLLTRLIENKAVDAAAASSAMADVDRMRP
ncbi:MAG: hypothetical protein LBK75_06220 [Oscillospiraceae bacterium]|nr:hypothetical protein [Oscillospiraceae bacterium]